MILNPSQIGFRDKQVLAGLYLSKFDKNALSALGFTSFTEAFNTLGYGLGGKPLSIKNYRDEFDPIFPNPRTGWKNRGRRDYCMKLEEQYRELSFQDFTSLIASFIGGSEPATDNMQPDQENLNPSSFAKRLMTGKAAERYFQAKQPLIQEFKGFELEDTTEQGCGYDFRLWPKTGSEFKAIEVKGMSEQNGRLTLTSKEYESAARLTDRFYLFIVKNFRDKPFHEIHANPVAGPLPFERKERLVVQVTWSVAA